MATAPVSPTRVEHGPPGLRATWQKYGIPILVLLPATAVIVVQAAVAQELEAQTTLLQSQLDYAQAHDELTEATGQSPQ
jgi:hypothetical protein